jgi:hypothetical protein
MLRELTCHAGRAGDRRHEAADIRGWVARQFWDACERCRGLVDDRVGVAKGAEMVESHDDLRMDGEATVWVRVTPDDAFASVAELTRMGEWSPENVGGEWLDSATRGVGSTFRGRNRGPQGEWETVLTVTEFDSPHRFAFVVASPGEEGTRWQYTFHAAEGGTVVTERFAWRWTPIPDEGFRGRIGRMPLPEAELQVIARRAHLQQSIEVTVRRLKEWLETPR